MPDDLTTTPEDYAVDPRAVLEMAEKATPGPWTPNVESDRSYYGPNDAYGRFYAPTFKEMPFTDFTGDQDAIEKQAHVDAEFLCLARTALPALARRVIATQDALAQCLDAIDFLFHGRHPDGSCVGVSGPNGFVEKLMVAKGAGMRALGAIRTKESDRQEKNP